MIYNKPVTSRDRLEIGSEFWIDDIPKHRETDIPCWLAKYGNVVLTASGRDAILLLLEEIQGTIPKVVLLPNYVCESVIRPFTKYGYSCYFYKITTDLTPDLNSINAFSDTDIGLFVHMGYFGFPTNNNLCDVIRDFRTKGIIVVEDMTHSLFSDFDMNIESDYYVGSIRKWMGLPSGGFIASRKQFSKEPSQPDYNLLDKRLKALKLKAQYIDTGNQELKPHYLAVFRECEQILDAHVVSIGIDSISQTLINSLNWDKLIRKRRLNYQVLFSELGKLEFIHPVFNHLPVGSCPMFYTAYSTKRHEILEHLSKHGIYCPVHWPKPEEVVLAKYNNDVLQIYNSIFSIPCDQRYNVVDMKRIVRILLDFGS